MRLSEEELVKIRSVTAQFHFVLRAFPFIAVVVLEFINVEKNQHPTQLLTVSKTVIFSQVFFLTQSYCCDNIVFCSLDGRKRSQCIPLCFIRLHCHCSAAS